MLLPLEKIGFTNFTWIFFKTNPAKDIIMSTVDKKWFI